VKRLLIALLVVLGGPAAADEPIRIAHVYDKTGPLAEYGRQLQLGLGLGFEYAGLGSNELLGRPLVIVEKDAQQRPEQVRAALAEAYREGAVLAVGPLASHLAVDALPVAAKHRKILLARGAADAITGSAWNRYVFRVAHNGSQEAIANAIVAARPGVCISTIAQDDAFGRDGITAYREAANKLGAIVFHEEYVPPGGGDLGAPVQRLVASLIDRGGCRQKYLFAIWAGAEHPFTHLGELSVADIKLSVGGSLAAPEAAYRQLSGVEGAAYYHHLGPDNAANDWLVMAHLERFNRLPTAYVAQGMAEAMFIAAAIRKANSTDTEPLIEAMEGLSFESPKGRLTMRPEDHQALQPMYHFRMAGLELELVREIKAREIALPIRNRP
jgi:branched-chain amino acid transport system substrate-binding protein